MKKNVGTIDAIMRITCGLTGVAWGTAQMVRRPNRSMPLLVTMGCAMKVAEGVTRFCPITALLKGSADQKQDQETQEESSESSLAAQTRRRYSLE